MTDKKRGYGAGAALAWVVAVCPLLLTGVMVALLTNNATRGFAIRISRENSVIELVTAGLMLAGGVFGLVNAWRARKRREHLLVWGFLAMFSVAMLFVGMEEIAWGQKLFAFETPASLQNLNKQHEMTLHNLPGLHGRSDMMWSTFALGGLIGIGLRSRPIFGKIATEPAIAPWFIIVLAIGATMIYKDYADTNNRLFTLVHRMDEFNEMLIAMACCLYLWFCSRRLKSAA
ncbi:MAG: hypothetical protein R3C45_13675 [Phycisphaerales bacterium]